MAEFIDKVTGAVLSPEFVVKLLLEQELDVRGYGFQYSEVMKLRANGLAPEVQKLVSQFRNAVDCVFWVGLLEQGTWGWYIRYELRNRIDLALSGTETEESG